MKLSGVDGRELGLVAPVAGFTLVAFITGATFGVTAAAAEVTVWQTLALASLFAGGAQFTVVAIVAAGGSAIAAIIAAVLLNARYGLLTMVAAVHIPMAMRRRLLASLLLGDPPVAMALAEPRPERRERVMWIVMLIASSGWIAGTLTGALLEGGIGDPEVFGLDAALPVMMLAILGRAYRDRSSVVAALTGALIGLALVPVAPPGIPVLAGSLGAVAAMIAQRHASIDQPMTDPGQDR